MDCPDCPIGLYIRSNSDIEEIFDDAPCISIVGTRDISPYGDEWCKRIVHSLAEAPIKPVIVSGLAYGVDICAHQAALDAGLRTIAVIPTGIDDLYPYYHRRIAERIASTPGCALISDFPLKTSPQAATFLRRNRIIAGLSAATILVESKQKGGGMITCSTAFSYGREAWVLPGRIGDAWNWQASIWLKSYGTPTSCLRPWGWEDSSAGGKPSSRKRSGTITHALWELRKSLNFRKLRYM